MSHKRITVLVIIGVLLLFSGAWWIGEHARDQGNDIATVIPIGLLIVFLCVIIWGGEKEDK